MAHPSSNGQLHTWSPLEPIVYDPTSQTPKPPPAPPKPIPQIKNTLGFFSGEFVSAAASISFHLPSGRVVLVHDGRLNQWFLPRGRKDVGESIESCAVREGFEESGYQGSLLPHSIPTKQPTLPGTPRDGLKTTEPIYTALMPHFQTASRLERNPPKSFLSNTPAPRLSHLYLVQYFVLALPDEPAEPVRRKSWKEGLVGNHEQMYESYLLPVEVAVDKLGGGHLVFDKDEKVIRVGDAYNGLDEGTVLGREQIVPDDMAAMEAWLVAEAWCAVGGEKQKSEA